MRIAFFTENSFTGKLARNRGGRTDMNWIIGLNATHYNFHSDITGISDIGIMIVPKKNPDKAFYFFKNNRNVCKKWCYLQEGPSDFFQNWSIENQINYLNLLSEVDLIFVHNESDKLYFEGIFPDKKVETFPSLLIEDSLPLLTHQDRVGSIISGNMCSWYGGMDSFLIGQILSKQVYAPSMGRRIEGEELLDGIIHLPYLSWQDWFLELNKRKFGINLMRTFAAGSFSLACARLKIPCLGWGRNDEKSPEGTDAQRLLFPELTIPTGNMKEAAKVASHLKENQLFYDHCAEYAYKTYWEIYSEAEFLRKFDENFK